MPQHPLEFLDFSLSLSFVLVGCEFWIVSFFVYLGSASGEYVGEHGLLSTSRAGAGIVK